MVPGAQERIAAARGSAVAERLEAERKASRKRAKLLDGMLGRAGSGWPSRGAG